MCKRVIVNVEISNYQADSGLDYEVKGKVSQNTISFIGVNETTCFGLLGGHHQASQSSKRLNIVFVWRMLRSHHLAYKLYMRHKLHVSM